MGVFGGVKRHERGWIVHETRRGNRLPWQHTSAISLLQLSRFSRIRINTASMSQSCFSRTKHITATLSSPLLFLRPSASLHYTPHPYQTNPPFHVQRVQKLFGLSPPGLKNSPVNKQKNKNKKKLVPNQHHTHTLISSPKKNIFILFYFFYASLRARARIFL